MPETLDRCQACRARLGEDLVCPRCACDYALVGAAMRQAEDLLEQALRSLRAGDRVSARTRVDASLAINRLSLGEAIRTFIDAQGTATTPPGNRHHDPAARVWPGG